MPRDPRQDATRVAPPGGKAAARERQFALARGLERVDGDGEHPPAAPPPDPAAAEQDWVTALRAEVVSPPDSPVWRPLGPTVIHDRPPDAPGPADPSAYTSPRRSSSPANRSGLM